jgi:hypothetical protein
MVPAAGLTYVRRSWTAATPVVGPTDLMVLRSNHPSHVFRLMSCARISASVWLVRIFMHAHTQRERERERESESESESERELETESERERERERERDRERETEREREREREGGRERTHSIHREHTYLEEGYRELADRFIT